MCLVAPLIAIVGCLGIAIELVRNSEEEWKNCESLIEFLSKQLQRLIDARPTAVNMRKEAEALLNYCYMQKGDDLTVGNLKLRLEFKMVNLLAFVIEMNLLRDSEF